MKIPECRGSFSLSWESAGVRASVSLNLIFGVGGGFWREKHFRLVTSAATALATILELTPAEKQDGTQIPVRSRAYFNNAIAASAICGAVRPCFS